MNDETLDPALAKFIVELQRLFDASDFGCRCYIIGHQGEVVRMGNLTEQEVAYLMEAMVGEVLGHAIHIPLPLPADVN